MTFFIFIVISFMQGIYTYIPETNHVPREYHLWCLYRQFLRWLYCTFTLALSSFTSWFPGMMFMYYYYYYYYYYYHHHHHHHHLYARYLQLRT